MFTPDTEWAIDDPWVPVQLEHGGGVLGVARVIEYPAGLYVDGNVFAGRTKALGERRELSPGLVDLITVRRPNGILEVVDATHRSQPRPPWPMGLGHEGRPRPAA